MREASHWTFPAMMTKASVSVKEIVKHGMRLPHEQDFTIFQWDICTTRNWQILGCLFLDCDLHLGDHGACHKTGYNVAVDMGRCRDTGLSLVLRTCLFVILLQCLEYVFTRLNTGEMLAQVWIKM